MGGSLRVTDVVYFVAELAVYGAVVWWGLTRDLSTPARWLLAIGALTVFAVSWGLFAAPRAAFALHGAGDLAFRVVWFGCGLTAAATVLNTAMRAR